MIKHKKMFVNNAIGMINIRDHGMDLNSENVAVQSLDNDGVIIDVSPAWLSMTGYCKDEVIGKFFGVFLDDDSLDKVKIEFSHLKDYGFVDNVLLGLKRKDGVIIEIALNGTSKYKEDGTFIQTFCEIRTLEYYLHSYDAINKILNREKFIKMVMHLKANISVLLLTEDFDFFDVLIKILDEPADITQVIIEPHILDFMLLDDEKKRVLNRVNRYILENESAKAKRVFIIKNTDDADINDDKEKHEYLLAMKVEDDTMPGGKRLIVIGLISQQSMLKEWEITFISISKIIDAVSQSIKTRKENKKLIEELKRLSETDDLTGIYNRAMINKLLLKQKNSYDRYKEKCSLIMVDIDYFKTVNDTLGHNAGDVVLREFAQLLAHSIRKTDVVGRWGGEEFIIICAHTDLQNTRVLAEALRKKIEEHFFSGVRNITASFGVSSLSDNMTTEQIVAKADKALYTAKIGGRNRVSG